MGFLASPLRVERACQAGDCLSPEWVVPQTAAEPSDNPVAVGFGCRPPSCCGAAALLLCVAACLGAAVVAGPAAAAPTATIAATTATTTATTSTVERDRTPLPKDLLNGTDTATTHSSSSSGGIARMIIGLGIVLVVIYGVYWLLKSYRKAKSTPSDGRIEVVATTALAPNRSIHLLKVGEEFLLVGSAEHGVTRLRVYDADQAAELGPLLEGVATANRLLPPGRGGRKGRGLTRLVEDLRWRTVR